MGCLSAYVVTAMLSMYPGQNAQGSFCHRNSRGLVLGARDFHRLEAAVTGGGGRLQPVVVRHPPSYLLKPGRGGGGQLGGGVGRRVWGGGFPSWGGLRATHYYHMHTSGGDMCLGRVWGSCWWLL